MGTRQVYIETYGCQMNQADSELIRAILLNSGYQEAPSQEAADVILLNTCAVREHAEQRVLGRINDLYRLKWENPDLILGVVGCMAQRLGKEIIHKNPYVGFVAGPDSYRRLPQLIEASGNGHAPLTDLNLNSAETYSGIESCRQGRVKAWVPIMRGCNNFCSYCIVPYVRGRERSRPYTHILREISDLVDQGYKEVMVLGQNVNSYRNGDLDFADLLRLIDEETGIARLRFLSPHPKDMSEKVLYTIKEGRSLCEHLHLPLQSGSSRILARMRRGYSAEQYLEIVQRARDIIGEIGLSTDVIVGFPGEAEQDFQKTLELLKEVEFDYAFTYKYSPREGTEAARLTDDVPSEEKQERLERLISLQRRISASKNEQLIGSRQEVLIEGRSRRGALLGRTRTDKPVALEDSTGLFPGDVLEVKIVDSTSATLIGSS